MVLTRAASAGDSKSAWVRDPASPNDGELTTQSTFANRTLVFEERYVTTAPSIFSGWCLTYREMRKLCRAE